MTRKRVYRVRDGRTFAENCGVADTFMSRFKGLMGRGGLAPGEGLLIEPCNSVHSFFMRFVIDVAYLATVRPEDAAEDVGRERARREATPARSNLYSVVNVRRAMAPWRVDFPVFGASAVLELPSGAAADLKEGDLLCLS